MDYGLIDETRNALLEAIPRILSLLDKNPYSSSYGSFDRKFWHYKIIDFPCGMQQELVLPLAYVWKTNIKNNIYFQNGRIEDYIKGIFSFHEKSCHPDGSIDDYFPYERAFGATAYALSALTEAAILCKNCSSRSISSFEKSGKFLSTYREAGRLSNHLAIASSALTNLYILTGNTKWKEESDRMINELKVVQSSEGWFPEYEGCDIGYQTVTIEFLAKQYKKLPNQELFNLIRKSVLFIRNLMHPDGSLGGEYGSRNTYNFYPGGFALLSMLIPESAEILWYFLKSLKNGSCNYLEDDGVFGHILSSYVTIQMSDAIKVSKPRNTKTNKQTQIKSFNDSGFYIGTNKKYFIYGSLYKGGAFKIFKGDNLISSDTGYIGKDKNGKIFCQNNAHSSSGEIVGNVIKIYGQFKKFRIKYMSSIFLVGLRILSLLFGRISQYSNFIRYLMQLMIIYNKGNIDIKFKRIIELLDDAIIVKDEIIPGRGIAIESLYRSTDCINMHVITSNSFQIVNLLDWEEINLSNNKKIELIKIWGDKKRVSSDGNKC
jgi:hypothetical protein